jgi:hypothetical protein
MQQGSLLVEAFLFFTLFYRLGIIPLPMHLLQLAIKRQQHSPACLILVAELLWFTWRERNSFVYQENTTTAPLSHIFKCARQKLQSRLTATTATAKQPQLAKDISVLDSIVLQLCPQPHLTPASSLGTGF